MLLYLLLIFFDSQISHKKKLSTENDDYFYNYTIFDNGDVKTKMLPAALTLQKLHRYHYNQQRKIQLFG